VVDTTPPVFPQSPGNLSFTCDAVSMPAPQITATDACSGVVPAMTTVSRVNVSQCAATFVLQFQFTAMDNCGNMASTSAYASVTNPFPPAFNRSTLPPNVTVPCGSVPPPADVTASSPCLEVTVVFSEQRLPGSCPNEYTLVRTWTAIDQCNNNVTYTQYIQVVDTIPPTIANITVPGPFQCPEDVPSLASMQALLQAGASSSPCPKRLNFSATEIRINGSCINDFRLVRTFTATDECGNTASLSVTLFVKDTIPPVLHGVPANINASCLSIPPAPVVTATDNCGGLIPVTYSNQTIPGSCAGSFTVRRTWTAIDECGNSASASQDVYVSNSFAPTFDRVPADIEVSCESIPARDLVSANGPCIPANVINLPIASSTARAPTITPFCARGLPPTAVETLPTSPNAFTSTIAPPRPLARSSPTSARRAMPSRRLPRSASRTTAMV